MKRALDHIADLQKAIRYDASIEEAENWWTKVLFVESALSLEQPTKRANELMYRVRGAVSGTIRDIRMKYPSPNASGALTALAALQFEIERNTTGLDGRRMRQ